MRTCAACGFENAEEGKSCRLCGASEITPTPLPADQLSTLALPSDRVAARAASGRVGSAVGLVYDGRFRVDALIGAGGMGEVFRAHDLEDGRDVALKVLHAAGNEEDDRSERFKREITVLSRIQHPAVPRILRWGTHEERLYFVSELVEGRDLKRDIQTRGAWPVPAACSLAATVADALATAHALGIVHRDVKPSNIMVGEGERVWLLDFGLARGVGIDIATLTKTGMIVGTPGYMSPEQFDGLGVDELTDIYSLGVVLFELLTARLPFRARTPIGVALKHRTEAPPLPRSLRSDLPVWLERIVLRCLEKDPAQRFASAEGLAAELRRPHSKEGPRSRRLPSGDRLIEDDSADSDWALVLASPGEKTGWRTGMGLAFRGRFFRLEAIQPPTATAPAWTYRFAPWPDSEILRRFVDYEQDCAERASARAGSLSSKLHRWIGGKRHG